MTPARFATPAPRRRRLGIKPSTLGLGCLGYLVLVVIVYVLSVLWWSLWLMIGVHAGHAETWSYWHTCTHWGALVPFVLA